MKIYQKLLYCFLVALAITSCFPKNDKTYVNRLFELMESAEGLPYELSPDGRWLVSEMCISPNETLYLFDVFGEQKIQIDITEDMPDDFRAICGMFWSPDSRSFVALGEVFPPEKSFVVIFNISDLGDVQKSIFHWYYNSNVGIEWSPDSSRIKIGTDQDRQTFIIDKKGALLAEYSLAADVSSGAWIDGGQYAEIRSGRELWITQPERASEELVNVFEDNILIIGYKPEKNMLLLLSEIDGLNFIPFDLYAMKELTIFRIPAPLSGYRPPYTFIPTTHPEISGISAHSTFWIFNWNSLKAENIGGNIDPVIWSQALNGFLYVKDYDYKTLVILRP